MSSNRPKKRRYYSHFDVPVGSDYANHFTENDVARHSWSPLIKYVKFDKRYRPSSNKTVKKERLIMYASHRDASILSMYSDQLVDLLERYYDQFGLGDNVAAYRPIGKSNYHFARAAEKFVKSKMHVTVMCFDVSKFFDHLNHEKIKLRLKEILGNSHLARDWYAVFKFITKYSYVDLNDLKAQPVLKVRLSGKRSHPLATIAEIKHLGVKITKNSNDFGIPQGTPISASISNLYMIEFDNKMKEAVDKKAAFYQRYSDDIIVACEPNDQAAFEKLVHDLMAAELLEIQDTKTDRKTLSGQQALSFQYLGYQLGHEAALIRPGALSKQWRSMRRATRKAEASGRRAIASGSAKKTFLKRSISDTIRKAAIFRVTLSDPKKSFHRKQ